MVFFGKLSKYYMYIMTTGRNPAVAGKPQSQQELRPRNKQETLSQDSGIYNTVSSRNTNLSQETGIYNTVSSRKRDGHLQYRELHKCTGTFIPRVGHIQYFELKHLSTQLYESVWKPPSTAIYTGHRPEVYSMKGYPDSCIQSRTNRLLVHYIKGTELLYFVEDVICLLN